MVATLAAAADHGIDAATLSFLTARSLEGRRKEAEEEEQKRQDKLLARRRPVSLEFDTLLVVPFVRGFAQEDTRVRELEKLLDRLDIALSSGGGRGATCLFAAVLEAVGQVSQFQRERGPWIRGRFSFTARLEIWTLHEPLDSGSSLFVFWVS